MKKGNILFVRGDSFISKIINRVDGEFSHVAVALSDCTILEAQRFTESRIVKNYHNNYDILELTLTELQLDKLLDTSLTLIGYDYDYRQVSYILFNNLFKVSRINMLDKFICSELVVHLLHRIGYLDDAEKDSLVGSSPNELYAYLTEKDYQIRTSGDRDD